MTTLPFSANTYKGIARKAAHKAGYCFRVYGDAAERDVYLEEARVAMRMAIEAGLDCTDIEARVQAWAAEA